MLGGTVARGSTVCSVSVMEVLEPAATLAELGETRTPGGMARKKKTVSQSPMFLMLMIFSLVVATDSTPKST